MAANSRCLMWSVQLYSETHLLLNCCIALHIHIHRFLSTSLLSIVITNLQPAPTSNEIHSCRLHRVIHNCSVLFHPTQQMSRNQLNRSILTWIVRSPSTGLTSALNQCSYVSPSWRSTNPNRATHAGNTTCSYPVTLC